MERQVGCEVDRTSKVHQIVSHWKSCAEFRRGPNIDEWVPWDLPVMIHQNIFMSNILDGVMRIEVKTEVYDKPSVQCDCDARRPMSAVEIKVGFCEFQCLDYNVLIALVPRSLDTLMLSKKAKRHSHRRTASLQIASHENSGIQERER